MKMELLKLSAIIKRVKKTKNSSKGAFYPIEKMLGPEMRKKSTYDMKKLSM